MSNKLSDEEIDKLRKDLVWAFHDKHQAVVTLDALITERKLLIGVRDAARPFRGRSGYSGKDLGDALDEYDTWLKKGDETCDG